MRKLALLEPLLLFGLIIAYVWKLRLILRDCWDARRNQRIYNGLRLAPLQTEVEQPQP
jgi:hypothetical protein